MKRELTIEEIKARFAEIDAMKPEEPTPEDLAAFAEADAENPEDSITLEEYMMRKECNGKLVLHIPIELHIHLAELARKNGVSLNQYALYKLAK